MESSACSHCILYLCSTLSRQLSVELCHCSAVRKGAVVKKEGKTVLMDWLLEWPCSLCIGGEEAGEKPQSVDAIQPSCLLGVTSVVTAAALRENRKTAENCTMANEQKKGKGGT